MGNQRAELSNLFPFIQTKFHDQNESFPPSIPLLILCVYLLILMRSPARGLILISHIVTFGIELECYGKMKILIFIPFLLSSVMERKFLSKILYKL